MKTNEEGNLTLAFVGKSNERGSIKGDQCARCLAKDANGFVVIDHRVGVPMGL